MSKENHVSTEYSDEIEPYRLLFPAGLLAGVLGVLLWWFFQIRAISFYPKDAHIHIMFFGFMWAFVSGFLMTAVPRITGTFKASIIETSVAVIFVIFQFMLNVRNMGQVSQILFGLQIVFLIVFLSRRFARFKQIPFEGFIFVPIAFAMAIVGTVLSLSGKSGGVNPLVILAGEGFILNLVMGLGSRLFPVLSRIPGVRLPDERSKDLRWVPYLMVALLLNGGYILAFLGFEQVANFSRVIAVVIAGTWLMRLHQVGQFRTYLGYGLRLAMIFVVLSLAFYSESNIALKHLMYIGGFSLMVLMVGTRVMIAHSRRGDLERERLNPNVIFVILLLCGAAVIRWYAGREVAGSWMTYAIWTYLAGVVLWGVWFVRVLREDGTARSG